MNAPGTTVRQPARDPRRRILSISTKIAIIFVVILVLTAAGWFGFPRIEVLRADRALESANAHMDATNRLLAAGDADLLDSVRLGSVDGIAQARDAVSRVQSVLADAKRETQAAVDDVGSAADYPALPAWYRDYLSRKRRVAELRLEQLQTFETAADRLAPLYGNGELIFHAEQDIDRMAGQYEEAASKVQSDPSAARAALDQLAAAAGAQRDQLQAAYDASGFELLTWLARMAKDRADLAGLTAQVADAAGRNDQATAQTSAQKADDKLMQMANYHYDLDYWQKTQIDPLKQDFDDALREQQSLGEEAASLFTENH